MSNMTLPELSEKAIQPGNKSGGDVHSPSCSASLRLWPTPARTGWKNASSMEQAGVGDIEHGIPAAAQAWHRDQSRTI